MTADIKHFRGKTVGELNPDQVLEALKGTLQGVVYAGYDHEGNIVAGSTFADGAISLWLLERAKQALFAAAVERII